MLSGELWMRQIISPPSSFPFPKRPRLYPPLRLQARRLALQSLPSPREHAEENSKSEYDVQEFKHFEHQMPSFTALGRIDAEGVLQADDAVDPVFGYRAPHGRLSKVVVEVVWHLQGWKGTGWLSRMSLTDCADWWLGCVGSLDGIG
jgi:hypothetical protein